MLLQHVHALQANISIRSLAETSGILNFVLQLGTTLLKQQSARKGLCARLCRSISLPQQALYLLPLPSRRC